MYGHVDAGLATEILPAADAGRIVLDGQRGRSTWSKPGQVAELAVRRAIGEHHPDALVVLDHDGRVVVEHRDGRHPSHARHPRGRHQRQRQPEPARQRLLPRRLSFGQLDERDSLEDADRPGNLPGRQGGELGADRGRHGPHLHGPGPVGRDRGDLQGRARHEPVLLEVPQRPRLELDVLGQPDELRLVAGREVHEGDEIGRHDGAGSRDRIAVRARDGIAQHRQDPLLDLLRDRALESLGLVVRLVPRQLENIDQKPFGHPVAADRAEFLDLVNASRKLHRPWVAPPATPEAFADYLRRSRRPEYRMLLLCRVADGALIGVTSPGHGLVSPLELGIRLINWSLTWQLLGGFRARIFSTPEGEAFRDRWLSSIYQHVRMVANNLSRFSSANNHLIGEATGVYVAASTWPLWPQFAAWGERCRQVLEEIEAYLGNVDLTADQHIHQAQFDFAFV